MYANPSLTQSELSLRWDRLRFESPRWFRHLWLRKVKFLMTWGGIGLLVTTVSSSWMEHPSHDLTGYYLLQNDGLSCSPACHSSDGCLFHRRDKLTLLSLFQPRHKGAKYSLSKSAMGGQAYLLCGLNQCLWTVHSQHHQWSKQNPKLHESILWLTDM